MRWKRGRVCGEYEIIRKSVEKDWRGVWARDKGKEQKVWYRWSKNMKRVRRKSKQNNVFFI